MDYSLGQGDAVHSSLASHTTHGCPLLLFSPFATFMPSPHLLNQLLGLSLTLPPSQPPRWRLAGSARKRGGGHPAECLHNE